MSSLSLEKNVSEKRSSVQPTPNIHAQGVLVTQGLVTGGIVFLAVMTVSVIQTLVIN